MAATAAARRVAASPARRATASRTALKPRPKTAPRQRSTAPKRRAASGSPARSKAPARRTSRSQPRQATGVVPLAVAHTAGAVSGIADSSLIVRLTRSRLWIGLLGGLLVGIVALNVAALSINAGSSKISEQTDGLRRANSVLRANIAGELSNAEVKAIASHLGLVFPDALAIRTVRPEPGDAATAASRLANGEITVGTVAAPETPLLTEEPVVPPAPVESAPVVP